MSKTLQGRKALKGRYFYQQFEGQRQDREALWLLPPLIALAYFYCFSSQRVIYLV